MNTKADPRPEFERDSSVFSTIDPRIIKEKERTKGILCEEEIRVVNSYKIMLFKLANNRFPGDRNEGDRCKALDAFAKKFKSGWPWKNNERLTTYATPQLIAYAEALSKRIIDVAKCQKRGDKTNAGKYS